MQRLKKTLEGLWSLIVGLNITGREFFKPQLTVHYPRRQVDNLASFRGHIELVGKDEAPDQPRCIVCLRCADNCPSGCITVRLHAAEIPDLAARSLALGPRVSAPLSTALAPPPETIERVPDVFHLNYSLCSLCGLCVQNCPVDAIRFTGNAYLVGRSREAFAIDLLGRLRAGAATVIRPLEGTP